MLNIPTIQTSHSRCRFKFIGYFSLFLLLMGTACQQNQQSAYERLSEQEKRASEYALLGLQTRPELQTTLFASEDMVVNPTNMDIDARGRVWVTEGYNYRPELNPENPTRSEGDRIVILEDTDRDGKADLEKVFYQGNDINSALGILVLDNRVIVSRSPHVFVLTDTDGDDRADQKQVLFSGISGEQHDHGVHAFVFGPDGRLYFNAGDAAEQIKDSTGDIITDKAGNNVATEGTPYRKGMVFRSYTDGSGFEVLGHNFRNPYEVAVDSYGTLWQSDNDDDGNRSVRINFVMEYGNYGYTDEVTGAGWRARRTNMSAGVPGRHWYQNDPGVVPNLLGTGAGSPTGIVVYEGSLLPGIFRGQMIHADAGPNVVRSYPVEKQGAGYRARIEPLLEGAGDQWFRPSDVTVAPDGSIFVADWYDPGVGGHQMGDQQRGRIFRIAPEGVDYRVPVFDLGTPQGSVEALKSPNMNLRARAWMKLEQWGSEAEEELGALWASDNPHYRARALWLLARLDDTGADYIAEALEDENPDIRITGLRAARQLEMDLLPLIQQLSRDTSAQVRRETAIALRGNPDPQAAGLWAELALQHEGGDRWQLEALGIGAAGQWDRFFTAWLEAAGPKDLDSAGGRDIVWRARTSRALPRLVEIIKDPSIVMDEKIRYFRAMDFHEGKDKQRHLVSLLDEEHPQQQMITIYTLKHLDESALERFAEVRPALERALRHAAGSYDFVDLVEKYNLENQNEELIRMMLAYPDSSLGVSAGGLALRLGGRAAIAEGLDNDQSQQTVLAAIAALGRIGREESMDLLQAVVLDDHKTLTVRKEAVKALGRGWSGENRVVELLRSGVIPESLVPAAAEVLAASWREDVRQLAGRYLEGQGDASQKSFPDIPELVAMQGDAERGRQVFEQSCRICHQVGNDGIEFGPALTEIGAKLPAEGLYEAILEPNAGISFGYEGYILTLNDGSRAAGIIRSETTSELELLTPGGYSGTYLKSDISETEKMEQSMMPQNLTSGMSRQELVDLVEYLSTLK